MRCKKCGFIKKNNITKVMCWREWQLCSICAVEEHPKEWVKKINYYIKHPSEREKYIKNGLKHVERFSYEKIMNDFIKLL